MSSPIRLPALIFIVLALIFLPSFITAQPFKFCIDNGNYTANSTYQINLNILLSNLSSKIDPNGFYNASVGQNLNRASAIVLCRGDIQLDACRNCVKKATVDILSLCPNQRQTVFWNEVCMLRYSDESIVATLTTEPNFFLGNSQNASTPLADQFMSVLNTLLDDLRGQAASGGSLRKVAARSISAPGSKTIFAFLQCTPDLTSDDCSSCLFDSAAKLTDTPCWGGRGFLPSCYIRFETYPFYSNGRLRELEATLSTPPPGPDGDNNTTRTIINTTRTIIIVVSIVAGLILCVFVGFLLRKGIKQKLKEEFQNADEISNVEHLQYEFGKIRDATNDFSETNKLGQGGFGVVYKGELLDGQEIAVKRLSTNSRQGNREFKNEVMLLAKLQHRNLVRLMGFSLEGTEKLLVYEFIQNASLDHFIFDPTRRSYLNWDIRYNIISGIARGLLYLHEDSRLRIIHRDLKAGNVLLDREMNPKIADFGMAKLFVPDETQGNTSRIVGTYGYMAPEYVMHGQFSVKSDVFSFGVLVLETISGQRKNSFRNGEIIEDLVSSAWRNWRDGTITNLIDPVLKGNTCIPCDILRCIHMGLLCVQENAADRPTMTLIVLMLNNLSVRMPIPLEPAFYIPHSSLIQELNSRELNSKKTRKKEENNMEHASQNDVPITELYSR